MRTVVVTYYLHGQKYTTEFKSVEEIKTELLDYGVPSIEVKNASHKTLISLLYNIYE